MSSNSIVLFDNVLAAALSGMTYPESESSAQALVEKELKAYECFKHADLTLIFGSKALVMALGGEWREADDAPASLIHHPLEDLDQLDDLNWSAARFENNARAQLLYHSAQQLDQSLAGQARIRFCMGAPYSQSAQLYSPTRMMKAMIKSKEQLHQLMEEVVQWQKEIVDQFASIPSLIFHLSDPLASCELISPKAYQQFAKPYTQQLVDYIHSYGKEVTLHICGNSLKILDQMVETGVDVLSLDQRVDLAEASQIIGSRAAILGNVDPVKVLQDGQTEQVVQAVDHCFEQAGDHPGGFILGPGCDLTYHTPLENVQAYMQAGRQHLN